MGFVITVITFLLFFISLLCFPALRFKKHSIQTFWVFPLCGALCILFFQTVTLNEIVALFFSSNSMNPTKILILFLTMTALSIFLDEAGLFSYIAIQASRHFASRQTTLFISFYLLVSFLTIFTSNDIVILTFTPFLCYFSKQAKINPLPYLLSEFVAANTWSLLFEIGNPTNLYMTSLFSIDFIAYTAIMALPTIGIGLATFFMLFFIFRKSLKKPLETTVTSLPKIDKGTVAIGLTCLFTCLIFLILSSYIGFEMWLITAFCAAALCISYSGYARIKKRSFSPIISTMKRIPWSLIPFVFSMFLFVVVLQKEQVVTQVALFLQDFHPIFGYGVASILSANIMNNLPMTVFFGEVLKEGSLLSIYAVIIGSNVGALLTPVGALAGIMWMELLKKQQIQFSFFRFMRYGFLFTLISGSVGFTCLWLRFLL